MTLEMTITSIAKFGIQHKIINSSYAGPDVYQLNSGTINTYPVLFTSPTGTHRVEKDTTTYALTLYYLDRLLPDSSNEVEVLSTAVEALKNIIWGIAYLDGVVDVSDAIDIRNVIETEAFSDRLGGAYATIEVTTLNNFTCPVE